MGLQDFFSQHPVFTAEAFASFLDAKRPRSARTRESLLAYYVRTGRILRVRRGLYAAVPPGADPRTCPVDPYLLAAHLSDDAVLAYHTALELYGKAHSVHEQFIYLTSRALRPLTFRSYRFRAIHFPARLQKKGQAMFGVSTVERSGLSIKVTGLERALVDLLDRPDLGGGWEEVWRSLETVEFFDLDRVVDYALLLENATTMAKVGFFLEQHKETLMVEESHLQALRQHRPRTPHYLDRRRKPAGRLVAEWNLIVPVNVLKHSWQEVL